MMKEALLKKMILLLIVCPCTIKLVAQPYLNVFRIQYLQSPDAGIFNRNKNKYVLSYTNISFTAPVKYNPIHGVVLFNPFFEQWSTNLYKKTDPVSYYQNFALAISFIDTTLTHKIRFAVSSAMRIENFSKDGTGAAQLGIVGLAIFQHKNITYKTGLYFNREYFGDLFIPLFGLDCTLSKKDKLFGILPGNMTWEHMIQKGVYYGITFSAITNSYRDTGNQYFRIDDNQFGLYTDIHLTKLIVLNAEAGHSIFRKLRMGQKNDFAKDLFVNDNFYFQLGIAYRIRFEK